MVNDFPKYLKTTSFFDNTENLDNSQYRHQDILSLKGFDKAYKEISSWHDYQPTPLASLDDLAKLTKVDKLYYKDENHRFSLKSFKALGGAYAVANLLIEHLRTLGHTINSNDLLGKKYQAITNKITVCCATDGNHGKSVAWGASLFGCHCEIFIHAHVSKTREKEIAKYGAIVHRIDGNYDDSVRVAAQIASQKNYLIVSDTSYKDYTRVPKDVMQGYTIMVYEALEQMAEKPTHIFLQAGVGGMAAAVASFVLETYESNPPILVLVEPNNADCLFQSAKNAKPTAIHGDLETIMAGLSCGEISILAWQILENKVHAFLTIEDGPIAKTMRLLASLKSPIIAGESGVAGLAAFLIIHQDKNIREKIKIDKNSKLLFFGTEGDTDELMYKNLVGKTAKEILNP